MATTTTDLTGGKPATVTRRLGQGDYSAILFMGVVTITATNIKASGIKPQASLIHVPSTTTPLIYELVVDETMPQLMNLITLTAQAHYKAGTGTDKQVTIVDSAGPHTIDIKPVKAS